MQYPGSIVPDNLVTYRQGTSPQGLSVSKLMLQPTRAVGFEATLPCTLSQKSQEAHVVMHTCPQHPQHPRRSKRPQRQHGPAKWYGDMRIIRFGDAACRFVSPSTSTGGRGYMKDDVMVSSYACKYVCKYRSFSFEHCLNVTMSNLVGLNSTPCALGEANK